MHQKLEGKPNHPLKFFMGGGSLPFRIEGGVANDRIRDSISDDFFRNANRSNPVISQ